MIISEYKRKRPVAVYISEIHDMRQIKTGAKYQLTKQQLLRDAKHQEDSF